MISIQMPPGFSLQIISNDLITCLVNIFPCIILPNFPFIDSVPSSSPTSNLQFCKYKDYYGKYKDYYIFENIKTTTFLFILHFALNETFKHVIVNAR